MYTHSLEKDRQDAERYLTEKRSDFVATYMAVSNLQFIIDQQPDIVAPSSVTALEKVLSGKEHAGQRQAYFLYKKAADALSALIHRTTDHQLALQAETCLRRILKADRKKPFHAAAQALGTLPLEIRGPCIPGLPKKPENNSSASGLQTDSSFPEASWPELLAMGGFSGKGTMEWKGRNLVWFSENQSPVLVVKMSRPGDDPAMLFHEGIWMDFLARHAQDLIGPDIRFQIPSPIKISSSFLFRLRQLPLETPENPEVDTRLPVIGFVASPEYFLYPNEHLPDDLLPPQRFYEIITRNALLLGRLAGSGIIHTAPIPLFHNRVQRHRRNDGGLYQWPRAGRLDQWLNSCRFPNIGGTGIRDFEHFMAFSDSDRRLYELIGSHIFSLVLVSGSYFRNADPGRVGRDAAGRPVDARDLFDPVLLETTVTHIFKNYYKGFTGTAFQGTFPMDLGRISARLVEEMGVDRHMEEILRVAEQNVMNAAEFHTFLASRGMTDAVIRDFEKGKNDITILTGPHLGGFNQPLSLPELTEFTAASAALCISGRYTGKKFAA